MATTDEQLQSMIATMTAQQARIDMMKVNYEESLDTIWMILAALLVFFMHAGFSLLEAGCVRFKNTQNILAKNLVVVTVGFLCWYVFGFAWALGVPEDPNKFMGHSHFVTDQFWDSKSSFRMWFFQGAFCATGGTIVSGAMAERTALRGFALYTACMTSWIYPLVVYWAWSGSGFLNYTDDLGKTESVVGAAYIDFAGSGVVHMVGGVGALVGAIVVGPRKDRWMSTLENEFDGHSIPFVVLGTFFLWFGWYGFNPGSTGAMHDAGTAHTAGLVAVNTTLSPCVAGLLVFVLKALVLPPKCLDVGAFCNGILAGLVSITAGCAVFKPWESVLVGLIGGLFYIGASTLMQIFKVDDVVDAFAVHGACGMWGVLAVGFFGNPDEGIGGNGVLYGGDQLRTQVFAIIVIAAWSAAWSAAVFVPCKLGGILRTSDHFQDQGADTVEHSPNKAYAPSA